MSRLSILMLFTAISLASLAGQACDELLILEKPNSFPPAADIIIRDSLIQIQNMIANYVRYGNKLPPPDVKSDYAFPDIIAYQTLRHFLAQPQEDPIAKKVLSKAAQNSFSLAPPAIEYRALLAFADLRGIGLSDMKHAGMGNRYIDYFAYRLQKAKRLLDIRTPIETEAEPRAGRPLLFSTSTSLLALNLNASFFKTNYPGRIDQLVQLQKFGTSLGMPNTVETLISLLLEAGYECGAPKALPPDAPLPVAVDVIFIN